ncbi:hypothetical protein PULV_a4060 [Pseudoalteromonas ulvae UL12]|uniref:hypothetical protein n=1 Tax=Pseudoalteromonas ulvae TaxID=107327 RepID=UPI00186B8C8E|nr:hypothetical protein [Pseudoalteromonas ulvae]MBE0362243.1 hypothetical protein [Pseudoalteromonas ulvae UL12]
MNTNALSKEGFTLIRNALEVRNSGGQQLAIDIAEALHNLPDDNSNTFLIDMTEERVKELASKYSECEKLLAYL